MVGDNDEPNAPIEPNGDAETGSSVDPSRKRAPTEHAPTNPSDPTEFDTNVPSISAETSWLPSTPRYTVSQPRPSHQREVTDPLSLQTGDLYEDFLIRAELGRGAVGAVYLAEQLSLRRSVALKVSSVDRSDLSEREGSTLAKLDHPSIVRVYSEFADPDQRRRTLCMQYVPGMTLRQLMNAVLDEFGQEWNGKDLLALLDRSPSEPVVMDAESIQDRAKIQQFNRAETICWLGAQLASALDYAHRSGILHGDVKPENTMVNRFGRPLLVDFNLAMESAMASSKVVGGTIAYMSPEVLSTFMQRKTSASETISSPDEHQALEDLHASDPRNDLYSLGVMLWEFASGQRPHAVENLNPSTTDHGWRMIFESEPQGIEAVPATLQPVLRQAIHVDPNKRFTTGEELADHLVGASHQLQAVQWQQDGGRLVRSITQSPLIWLILAALFPHALASVLQVTYNHAEILETLSQSAEQVFQQLLIYLNVLIYGSCVVLGAHILFRVWKPYRDPDPSQDLDAARRELLRYPKTLAILGTVGWMSGSLLFPGLIHWFAEPLPLSVWAHFFFSFGFACSIAVVYAYALMTFVIVMGCYPNMHGRVSDFRKHATKELLPIRQRWDRLTWFAGVIPLAAANLLVLTHKTVSDGSLNGAFQLLMVLLILSGAIGFTVMGKTGKHLHRMVDRCLGTSAGESTN